MQRHKILIVDDSKAFRMSIENMLSLEIFELIEAKDGLEGYSILQQESPRLIMLNLLMPRMSGWELYQEIQKQQSLRTIPILFVSGRKEELTDRLAEPFEHFAFLEKPFTKHQLLHGMREATIKAKKSLKVLPEARSSNHTGNFQNLNELETLRKRIVSLESEIEQLKKQINHEVTGLIADLGLDLEGFKQNSP
jgi:CheY-like chemotaxis protein